MYKFPLINIFVVSFAFASGTIASNIPLGIPDPSGSVPTAIMPSIPEVSNQKSAFPYDPISTPTPAWVGGTNQFYVDKSSSVCNDSSNNGRGSPERPLCSIPGLGSSSWTLDVGAQVFIAGDGASYGSENDLYSVNMEGTADAPIWIIGVGEVAPKMLFRKFRWGKARHVFFDSVHFHSPNNRFIMRWDEAVGPTKYFTFRRVECSGSNGVDSSQGGRCFMLGSSEANPLEFVVFYESNIHGLGRWQDDRRTSVDIHGIQLGRWTRYVWILNSEISHVQGDSIQCANSNWFDYDYASRPHYIYIGGNEFYENYENAYDQKGCYHVVFSENYVHGFYNAEKPANSTAIITEQDSESDIGGLYTWFINNKIENTGTAFGSKATTSDAYVYILGNEVSNISKTALAFTQRCYSNGSAGMTCPKGLTFAQNTVDCGLSASAITNVQNPTNSNQRVEIDGNIFYNCVDTSRGTPHGWESFSDDPLFLIHTQNVHYRDAGGDIDLADARYDVLTANIMNKSIEFASGSYQLQSSSPAIGAVRNMNSAYATFMSLYGLDIRKDINGNVWTETGGNNAGAHQETMQYIPLAIDLSSSAVAPFDEGDIVEYIAKATGIYDTLEYRFTINGAVVQSWSGSNRYLWNTTGFAGSNNVITVEVRDIKNMSSSDHVSVSGVVVLESENLAPASLEILSPTNESVFLSSDLIELKAQYIAGDIEAVAKQISWNSNIDGRLGDGLEFNIQLSSGRHTIVAETIDSDNVMIIDEIVVNVAEVNDEPSSSDVVDTVDGSLENESAEDTSSIDVISEAGVLGNVELVPHHLPPYYDGEVVSFVASATGGTGDYQYKFQLNGETVQSWSSSRSFNWDTSGYADTESVLRVLVRNSDGSGSNEDHWMKGLSVLEPVVEQVDEQVDESGPLGNVQITARNMAPYFEGEIVSFTVSATGGTGDYQYKFQVNGDTVQPWSSSDSYDWNTSGYVGSKNVVRVLVRNSDRSGKSVDERMKGITVVN
ncbi:hypothetical protein [Aurantivibrio plasticivorans]